MKEELPQNNNILLKYAGLGAQMLVALGLAAFIGYEADKWIKLAFPLFIWLLPLLALIGIIVRVIKDTSKK